MASTESGRQGCQPGGYPLIITSPLPRRFLNPPFSLTTARMSAALAIAAVDAAAAAFPVWSALGPTARRAALIRAAAALQARAPAFIAAMSAETGATEAWARFNLSLAASMLREAASITTQITGSIIPSDQPGCLAMAVRQPAGVVLGIAPWNAPIILGVRAIATPLACGNSVILKASERCPRTHALIIEAMHAADFPPGTVNLVTHAPGQAAEIVGALIDHPAIRRINFTGSTEIGRQVAIRAAQNLKPVLLELGGKAPLLVLDDADLDHAAAAASFGAFANQGQICMSTERAIVLDAVADAFAARLAARAAHAPPGALIDTHAITRVQALIDAALAAGAVQLCGGPARATVMPPHVLDHVTESMRLFHQESFGPVVAITRARNDAHAIALANATEYGLSAAIHTKDIARGLKIAQRIQSGICHINGATVHDEAQMPFGGTKSSGHGRFGGQAGIDAFTEMRWITVETEAGVFPF